MEYSQLSFLSRTADFQNIEARMHPELPLFTDEPFIRPKFIPNLLVVDDDPVFGRVLSKIAEKRNVPLTFCSSVREVGKLPNWGFDVGIIDYDLGVVTGLQFIDYLERFINKIPIILVSQYRQIKTQKWPGSVKNFLHKSVGPYEILSAAFHAHDLAIAGKSESDPVGG